MKKNFDYDVNDEHCQTMNYSLVDLHLHLDGSISLNSARELAKMQSIELPENDEELGMLLQVKEDCKDLNEYLEKFKLTISLLQTKEAISTAVFNLERDLQALGLIYAEIRFAPQLHTQKGLTQKEIVEAAIDGMNRCDFCSNLILCCMRGDNNYDQNIETIRLAKKYLGKGVVAADLAGAEALYPTENFENLFQFAMELDVPFTIHAGEALGPSSVYTALSFGAKRIGHGVRSTEDKKLLKILAQKGVTLELCPTSNLNTNIYKTINEYPLIELMQSGVSVTINSDNMIVSKTNVRAEFQKITETFCLTNDQLLTLTQNAIKASFADDETKNRLFAMMQTKLLNKNT